MSMRTPASATGTVAICPPTTRVRFQCQGSCGRLPGTRNGNGGDDRPLERAGHQQADADAERPRSGIRSNSSGLWRRTAVSPRARAPGSTASGCGNAQPHPGGGNVVDFREQPREIQRFLFVAVRLVSTLLWHHASDSDPQGASRCWPCSGAASRVVTSGLPGEFRAPRCCLRHSAGRPGRTSARCPAAWRLSSLRRSIASVLRRRWSWFLFEDRGRSVRA